VKRPVLGCPAAQRPGLPVAAALEAYAVLTRLPPPHRASATIVGEFLRRAFPVDFLVLPDVRMARLVDDLLDLGIAGGASYDAVIAMTAAHHRRQLATLDARARATYERVGVEVRSLG
jgi:predicted nucleic acid-binding protein